MWTIPPEQNLHSQTWLAYPWDRRIWGSDLSAAQRTVTKLIRVISSYEPVRLLALPIFERSLSKRFAASEIEIVPANYNDIWVRDTLPTFAVSAEPALIAIDWHFNGWGKIPGLPYKRDATVGHFVARIAGATIVDGGVVAEGGAFAFDGHDTVVATKSVMLHSRRNGKVNLPYLQKSLQKACNRTSVCWLPGDASEPISRGHADAILAFGGDNTVFVHWVEDEACWERRACERNLQAFKSWMDRKNRKYDVIKLSSFPSPKPQYGTSYVNFAHVNGAVVVPTHGGEFSKFDDRASRTIGEVLGKPVVPVLINEIAAYGGGIHCCTQQEPLV